VVVVVVVVVVAGIVAKYGVDGLFMCTMMAGVMLVVMGLTGMGSAVRFIPRSVVVGFTNGIAVLIASTQLRDFFGIDLKDVPGEFGPRMAALASHAATFSPQATAVAAATLLIILGVRLWWPRLPGSILALCAATLGAYMLGLHVDTVASRFGGIPSGLPHVAMPAFRASLDPHADDYIKDRLHHSLHRLKIPSYVRVFRIHGPFLFGATDKLNVISDTLDTLPDIVVLRLRNMNAIDGTGLLAFEELADRLHESGRQLLLCGARKQPAHLMERADFHRHVGNENICHNIGDAIARAEALHNERLRRSSAEQHEASA
jgi:MFS superfamily sulfate permease-like transporter